MVSAVILSYNRCEEVIFTLKKLSAMKADLPFELQVIVVDNASADDTSVQIKKLFPEVTLVSRVKNNGIAGWNDGFALASQKYMLVLDDDSCIESGLPEAVTAMENDPGVGILAMNIVDANLKGDPNLNPEEAWQDGAEVVGFIGCGALIRKEVYNTIGGYSEWMHLYTHEFDYSIRCMHAGFSIKFFEKGVVVHRVSNLNRSKKSLLIFATRNELAIVFKYFSTDRFKFLTRTLLNNLKILKREGIKSAWYVGLGFVQFLKLKKQLTHTPVSGKVQDFYAHNFWSAKPVIKSKTN